MRPITQKSRELLRLAAHFPSLQAMALKPTERAMAWALTNRGLLEIDKHQHYAFIITDAGRKACEE